ncbi:hypothetical protein C8Q70DRAFT_1053716 [Cubamyces menziesii]|nr:hypothetical protein C8Q70DRAFT_1053716 [Cubamyces menziesii]
MADSADQEFFEEVISDVYYFTVDNICEVAGIALLTYDYLLTFSGEIQFVWSRKFSGATVVFVLNRYVTLFSKIVLPISTFWWPNQTDQRLVAHGEKSLINTFNLSHLRFHGLSTVVEKEATLTQRSGGDVISIVTHTCAIGADLLVIVLTWIKTYQMKKEASVLGSGAAFSSLILRDGTLYFGTMLVLNVVHLIVLQSTDTLDPLPIFVDVFTSILISRFMINLRQVAGRGSDDLSSASRFQGTSRFSSVRFAADIVGDLGAPLEHRGLGDTTPVDPDDVSESFTDSPSAGSQTQLTEDSLSTVTRHSPPPTLVLNV